MAVRGTLYIQAQTVQLMFDAALTVPNETHSFGNEIVSQTLEDGSNISDHIIILQDELEVQIFVSNSVLQESQDTYAALKAIRNKRELCTVFTDHEIYENMAIESVSAPHEAPMVNSITFTVKFKRIDWVGAVANTYPPAKFQPQAAASMAAGYGHEQQTGMQQVSQGKMGPVDAVDMTASTTQDVGEIAGKTAGGANGSIDTIWSFVQQLMLERNTDLPQNELKEKIELIKSNARFITGLSVTPQKFNASVEGQAIGFDLFFDPLLLCWKCNMTDANEDNILTDITLMAGNNACQGLQLKYHATDDNDKVIEEDLVIRGLFVTEPRGQRFDKYERGIESSKFAFTPDSIGNPACAIVYFTSEESADAYNSLINGERQSLQVDLDDMDYTIEVK